MPFETADWIRLTVELLVPLAGIVVAGLFMRRAMWPAILTIGAMLLRIVVVIGFLMARLRTISMIETNDGGADLTASLDALWKGAQLLSDIASPVSIAPHPCAQSAPRAQRHSTTRQSPPGTISATYMIVAHKRNRDHAWIIGHLRVLFAEAVADGYAHNRPGHRQSQRVTAWVTARVVTRPVSRGITALNCNPVIAALQR